MNIIISSISGMEYINDFALNPVQLFLNPFYFKKGDSKNKEECYTELIAR